MGGRASALAFLALLLAPLTTAPALTAPQAPGQSWERSCTVWIVAVSSGGGGVLGNLTVTVRYPGEGRVYISTSPAAMVDTQGSARLAAFAASLLAGVDMSGLDFYYDLESDSIIVGGPSAGAAMALATYAVLAGLPCPEGVAATGMIQPDTSIGPVGGLREKLEAAAGGGARLFIIPAGQEVYTYYERVVRRVGPFTWTEVRPVKVNLTELGEQLGVEVREAATLAEAARLVWGGEPLEAPGRPPGVPGWLAGLLDSFARWSAGRAEALASGLAAGEGFVAREARAALEAAGRAVNLSDYGDYYAAALAGVEALDHALAANITAEALASGLDVTWAVEAVNETIMWAWSRLEGLEPQSLPAVEAAAYAYAKLGVAAYYYQLALEVLEGSGGGYRLPATLLGVDTSGASLLARAWSLAYWALFWANATLEAPPTPQAAPGEVGAAARLLAAQARTTVAYLDALLSEAGRVGGQAFSLAVRLAEEAAAAERPEAAVGLAAESIALATSVIHETFTLDPNATLAGLLDVAASLAAGAPGGVHSRTLYSLAESRAQSDPVGALAAASKAVVYAWLEAKLSGALEYSPGGQPGQTAASSPTTTTPSPATPATGTTAGNATSPAAPQPRARLEAFELVAVAVVAGVAVGAAVALAESRRR